MMNRRDFLKALTLASAAPMWVRFGSLAAEAVGTVPTPDHMLLVVFLNGGNDGLNTVAPYADAVYKKLRPTIGLKSDEVFPLASGLGLHKALARVNQFWAPGNLAIVHNVGYPNPNFSHFDSAYIWETGSSELRYHTGWLGRYLDATDGAARGPVRAIAVGMDALPRTLIGEKSAGVAMTRLSDFSFVDDVREDASLRRRAFVDFASDSYGDSLRQQVLEAQVGTVRAVAAVKGTLKPGAPLTPAQTVASMFAAGVGTEVGFIQSGGFDTHTAQKPTQSTYLKAADKAIGEFFDMAKTLGIADRCTVVTVSEFGRRVGENANNGTDHGSSTSMMVMGSRVRGGSYGNVPDLTKLKDGNLVPEIHMGSVYSSIISGAFKVDPDPIVGGSYATMPLLS